MTATATELTGTNVDEGESCDLTIVLYDATAVALVKASIITLTVTLLDQLTGAVINSRNAQDILDANGGALATDGTLVLRLQPLDNTNVNATPVGEIEKHEVTIKWTWNDGVLVADRTGKHTFILRIAPLTTPVP